MTVVAALLDTTAATVALRRAVPKSHVPVRGCRSPEVFGRLLETNLVDIAVIGFKHARGFDLARLRGNYPFLPIVVYGPLKPDHGDAIRELSAAGVSGFLVEGLDDPVLGETVTQSGYLARRRRDLKELPRLLRLSEPVQRATFDTLLGRLGPPPSTKAVARSLGVSREHLSRQFGAGGAPNLKRVIDLLQVLATRDLVSSPGYSLGRVVSLLGYAGPSHLRNVVRRVTRLPFRDFRRSSAGELTRRFAGQGTRSRG
ncbi:MAG: helix-turn-helix transcriptional regulator [Gemmatimonadetes bacterium]|nr:helix-turn-helix transcriptional regulator [Gemmatimonadota bacterium]